MFHRTLLLCLTAATLMPAFASAEPTVPQGIWMWDDGRAGVEFHPCGQALCGRIVWLKSDEQADSAPMLDAKNPDAELRKRRVCGIDYITGVKSISGKYRGGRIYDFNSGSTYDLDIESIEPGQIIMRGYKSIRLLGTTLKLIRPKAELIRCDIENRG